jgi:hypothetical protein
MTEPRGKQQMDPQGNVFTLRIDDIPKDVGLLSTRTIVLSKDGKELGISDGVYNHHIAILNLSKDKEKLIACPGGEPIYDLPYSVFAGVGEDRGDYQFSSADAKVDTAYELRKSDTVMMTAEFINYGNENINIYAALDLNYIPGLPKLSAYSHTLSANQCVPGAGKGIRPKNGETNKFNRTSDPMTIQMDGYIFNIRK